MNVYAKLSRAAFNHPRCNTKGKGLMIEVHMPDELAEDEEAYERIMSLVGKRLRDNLKDGVFKGTVKYFTLD